jgi:hypothetical protein
MGGGSWNSSQWSGYAAQNVSGKSQSQIFTQRGIHPDLDPLNFKNGLRESVDGDDNPLSTPIAIFTDVTGSMGVLAETVVRTLDTVCTELYDRKPVTDPHLMTGAIGDAYTDSSPFQATQFEADIRIAEQTKNIYLEKNGGGNGGESYALAWLFAGMQTATDAYDKRGKKGYIFTVGDEPVHGVEGASQGLRWGVTKEQAKRILGLDIERDLTADECLAMAKRRFNVFHIVVNSMAGYRDGVERTFGVLMPDNLIWLEDIKALSETIVSVIEVNEGRDKQSVAASWSGDTSIVIAKALNAMVPATASDDDGQAVVRL